MWDRGWVSRQEQGNKIRESLMPESF